MPKPEKAPLGFALGAAFAIAAAAAIIIPTFTSGGVSPASPRPAGAAIIPADCDPTAGAAAAAIRITNAPAPPAAVADGTVLSYKVGASYPPFAGGVACNAFNIDVFIDVPGPTGWQFVCNIDSMAPGPGTTECAGTTDYVANGAHRVGTLLVANVKIIGDKHDREEGDCIAESRVPTDQTTCFDAAAVSVITLPHTPTPTFTPTATNTPTNTPTRTNTPANTPTRTKTPRPNTATPRPDTSTPAPDTATPVNTVLPTRVVPTPTRPAGVIIVLPDTGTGGGGTGGGSFALAAASAALAGVLAFAAGAGLRRRAR